MAGAGEEEWPELFLHGLLSNGCSTGKYRLIPSWEDCPGSRAAAEATASPQVICWEEPALPAVEKLTLSTERGEDRPAQPSRSLPATTSLVAPSNPESSGGVLAVPTVQSLTLVMERQGVCLASFPLVPLALADDGGNLHRSHLTLHIDEDHVVLQFFKNEGSSSKWISKWMYSIDDISHEGLETIHIFGDIRGFQCPILQNLACPPLKINFLRNFACDGEIGSGTEGSVYKCYSNSMGVKKVAIKKVQLYGFLNTSIGTSETSEAQIMSMLTHSNIVRFYHSWIENSSIFIGMELCERTLQQYLAQTSKVDQGHGEYIFKQITEAIDFMHHRGVVHRDIKPGNILLNEGLRVKVADFGLAKRKQTPHGKFPAGWYGCLPYRAPEIINTNSGYDEKVDIFSMGIIYFEIFVPGVRERKIKTDLLSRRFREFMQECDNNMVTFDLDNALEGTDVFEKWGGDSRILKSMLKRYGDERPSAREIMGLLVLQEEFSKNLLTHTPSEKIQIRLI